MPLFGVQSGKEKNLRNHMARLGIREADLKEKFIRSQGRGGQRLNKTATCVYLKHLPTGLEVKMQRERSQGLNRFLARRALLEKYERSILGIKTGKQRLADKKKKQKKRRKRRTAKKRGNVT